MGRSVIEAPPEEIAEFLSQPEAPLSYDNHVVVISGLFNDIMQTNSSLIIGVSPCRKCFSNRQFYKHYRYLIIPMIDK